MSLLYLHLRGAVRCCKYRGRFAELHRDDGEMSGAEDDSEEE